MRVIFVLLTSLFLAACTANGTRFEEANFSFTEGKGELYIFRLNKFVDGGSCYEFSVDGRPIGVLGNGGFLRIEIDPGEHFVSVPMINKEYLQLSIEQSVENATYLQFNVSLNSEGSIPESVIISKKSDYKYSQSPVLKFNNLLVQVASEYALNQLKDLRDSSVGASCMATLREKN